MWDSFKMIRIHTCMVPAKMIYIITIWYNTLIAFIENSVSKLLPSIEIDAGITVWIYPPQPYPAAP